MDQGEFVAEVRARAGLAGTAEAEAVIRATLVTLAERMPEGMTENLAAQLPGGIGEHLRAGIGRPGPGTIAAAPTDHGAELVRPADRPAAVAGEFVANEFVARVAERAGLPATPGPAAARVILAARVVLEVTDEAGKCRIMERLADLLPPDLTGWERPG
jgi:uncharacterized protein (DUF2267 family)